MGSDGEEKWEGQSGADRPRSPGKIAGQGPRSSFTVREVQDQDRRGPRSPHSSIKEDCKVTNQSQNQSQSKGTYFLLFLGAVQQLRTLFLTIFYPSSQRYLTLL